VESKARAAGSKSSREPTYREEVGPDISEDDEAEPSDSSRDAKDNFQLLAQNRTLKKYPTAKSRSPKRLQELDNTMDEVGESPGGKGVPRKLYENLDSEINFR